jgi:hypothetical protein
LKINWIKIGGRFERFHSKSFRLFAQETGSYKASASAVIKLLKLKAERRTIHRRAFPASSMM